MTETSCLWSVEPAYLRALETSCLWSVEAAYLRALAKRDMEHWRRRTEHESILLVPEKNPRKYKPRIHGKDTRLNHHKKTEESYKRLLRANP